MQTSDSPQISKITSLPFDENTYIIGWEDRQDCIVVDPGLEPGKILDHLDSQNLRPAVILNTHGHSDHIAGNAALKQRWPDCPLVIGRGDADKLTDPVGNLSAMFGLSLTSPTADETVSEGDTYEAAGLALLVRETPGHCSGHVVFICQQCTPAIVIGGDVLFRQGIGRSDFPDSDPQALERSIRTVLYALPDETIVYPGHGPETTIGFEKAHNPFVPMA